MGYLTLPTSDRPTGKTTPRRLSRNGPEAYPDLVVLRRSRLTACEEEVEHDGNDKLWKWCNSKLGMRVVRQAGGRTRVIEELMK
jgi:hypothetical protein